MSAVSVVTFYVWRSWNFSVNVFLFVYFFSLLVCFFHWHRHFHYDDHYTLVGTQSGSSPRIVFNLLRHLGGKSNSNAFSKIVNFGFGSRNFMLFNFKNVVQFNFSALRRTILEIDVSMRERIETKAFCRDAFLADWSFVLHSSPKFHLITAKTIK